MRTLVIAEHDGCMLKTSTLCTITAAVALNNPVDVLVAGEHISAVVADAQTVVGVDGVFYADDVTLAHGFAEPMTALILQSIAGYSAVLAPASTLGKDILPRVSACQNIEQISDVVAIVDGTTVVRPIYAGNALVTIHTEQPVKMMTIRASAFDAAVRASQAQPTAKMIQFEYRGVTTEFVRLDAATSDRPELTSAAIVVSGGRALKDKNNFALIEALAAQLGAAVGATRAAVDAGIVPNDYQVGQTGKVVAPTLYIAIGISGAIQHLAGMKDAKVIVAINKDPDAAIFQVADYGLVADLFDAVPALMACLSKGE